MTHGDAAAPALFSYEIGWKFALLAKKTWVFGSPLRNDPKKLLAFFLVNEVNALQENCRWLGRCLIPLIQNMLSLGTGGGSFLEIREVFLAKKTTPPEFVPTVLPKEHRNCFLLSGRLMRRFAPPFFLCVDFFLLCTNS